MAVALQASCYDHEEDIYKQDTIPLTFYLQTSGGKQTRGYEGLEEAIDHEDDINSVEVWLYDGSNFVGYSKTLIDNNKIRVNIPEAVASKGSIDVYVIANGKSVGLENLGSIEPRISLETLRTKLLGGSTFLPTANGANRTKEVPSDGLPFSQMLLGVPITSTGLQATLPDITLTRAVSKFRFAFARSTGMNDVAITGIELKGSLIASHEYIFPKQDTETEKNYGVIGNATYYGDRLPNLQDATYETNSILWGANTQTGEEVAIIPANDINEVDYPEQMTFDYLNSGGRTMTGPNYEDYVTENFIEYKDANDNTLYHDSFLTYLRETDKPLEVTIYYRLLAEETKVHKTSFTMMAANDFARNHIWTVYAYFKGNRLVVKPIVQPWDLGGRFNDYRTDVGARLGTLQQYLRWDTDGDLSTWNGSYVAVTHEWDNMSQVPGRTPLINLTTSSSENMYLQLDNKYFEFVLEETVGGTTTYRELGVNTHLEISSGINITTKFFVRPIKAYDTAEQPVPSRECHMSLVRNGTVPAKVPLRSSMPGFAEGVDEVWFYWVSPDNYKEYANGAGPDGASSEYIGN
ncbi:MAG: hypothetical protein J6W19_06505 [Prevotella sp.]|nr:hypothetical protein [Prevotella sp.]